MARMLVFLGQLPGPGQRAVLCGGQARPSPGRHPAHSCLAVSAVLVCVPPQERTGVKMVMIQDGPLPTGADKPLRMTGDPFKVQVGEKPSGAGPGCGVSLGSNSAFVLFKTL